MWWVLCIVGGGGVRFVRWGVPGEGVGCGCFVRGGSPCLCVNEVDGFSPSVGQPLVQCFHGLGGHHCLLLDQEWDQLCEYLTCLNDVFVVGWWRWLLWSVRIVFYRSSVEFQDIRWVGGLRVYWCCVGGGCVW